MQTLRADIAIIGAGLGGCAAALAAARIGKRVILTEETRWIGGQLTSQAVPPDEHPMEMKLRESRKFTGIGPYYTARPRGRARRSNPTAGRPTLW